VDIAICPAHCQSSPTTEKYSLFKIDLKHYNEKKIINNSNIIIKLIKLIIHR